jgi:hypothetical protein
MAITSMSWLRNPSSKASRSAVIVKKVRVYSWTGPSAWGIIIVVTTVFLCTSQAAQRSWITCIASLLLLHLLVSLHDQREVRKDRQLSSACSALAGGTILLFWTHLNRLPSADSQYQLLTDLCLLITSSFSPIFIFFSGSQSHRASPEMRGRANSISGEYPCGGEPLLFYTKQPATGCLSAG